MIGPILSMILDSTGWTGRTEPILTTLVLISGYLEISSINPKEIFLKAINYKKYSKVLIRFT